MFDSIDIAKRIKETAKKKGLSTGKMLSACDLSKNTLSSMQSGGYNPRLENLTKIADYLDCSVDYLLGRTDYPEINNGKIIIDGETIDGTIHEISNGYIVTDPDAELTPEDIKEIRNIIEN